MLKPLLSNRLRLCSPTVCCRPKGFPFWYGVALVLAPFGQCLWVVSVEVHAAHSRIAIRNDNIFSTWANTFLVCWEECLEEHALSGLSPSTVPAGREEMWRTHTQYGTYVNTQINKKSRLRGFWGRDRNAISLYWKYGGTHTESLHNNSSLARNKSFLPSVAFCICMRIRFLSAKQLGNTQQAHLPAYCHVSCNMLQHVTMLW